MHTVYFCKETGEFYCHSEYGDEKPLPDDLDNGNYIQLPQKTELGLGRNLVIEFASEFLPERLEDVYSAFRKKGAYSKFRQILDEECVIEQWFEHEKNAHEKAIKSWCQANKIKIGLSGADR